MCAIYACYFSITKNATKDTNEKENKKKHFSVVFRALTKSVHLT